MKLTGLPPEKKGEWWFLYHLYDYTHQIFSVIISYKSRHCHTESSLSGDNSYHLHCHSLISRPYSSSYSMLHAFTSAHAHALGTRVSIMRSCKEIGELAPARTQCIRKWANHTYSTIPLPVDTQTDEWMDGQTNRRTKSAKVFTVTLRLYFVAKG